VGDPWRPRPHDHLIEPLFGGLGEGPTADPARGRRRGLTASRALLLAAVVAALGLALAALALAA
jgi:hypothetical protein